MRKKILIVGQNQETRNALFEALTRNGFRSVMASNPDTGLFQLYVIQPDLVILDLDDDDALQQFRRLTSVPIVALQAEDDENAHVMTLDQGADCCLPESVSIPEIRARAQALLRRSQALPSSGRQTQSVPVPGPVAEHPH